MVHASDERALALDDLHALTGGGPVRDALRERGPVLVPDLQAGTPSLSWAAFRGEARERGVGAILVFPQQIGVVQLGMLTLHGPDPVVLRRRISPTSSSWLMPWPWRCWPRPSTTRTTLVRG